MNDHVSKVKSKMRNEGCGVKVKNSERLEGLYIPGRSYGPKVLVIPSAKKS